jgi:hypothetical protein
MFFCGTCGMMVRTETNICPKCSSTLAPAYVSGAAKANLTPARKQRGNAARVLLIGAIVLSLVAVATSVTYHVVMRPGRSVYLLPDGNVMAYINFTPMHFMNTDTSPFTADLDYQRFVNDTGIRVDRDLENIAISARVDGGPGGEVEVIVTGAFDQQRLSGYVRKQEGVQTETYSGKTIFSAPVKDQTARFCVLDSKMVAFTVSPTAESMRAIIDKSAGSGSAPSLFENYYSDVPFASAMWAIVHVPSSAITDSAPGGMNLNFLKNSVTIVSLRYTGSLRFRGEFIAANQADATNIFQAVNGLLAMSKLAGGPQQNDPDVAAVMNSIEVKQNGNHVVVSVVVPQDVIQKAAQKHQL